MKKKELTGNRMSTKNINGEYITEKTIRENDMIECYFCGQYDVRKDMQLFISTPSLHHRHVCRACSDWLEDDESLMMALL